MAQRDHWLPGFNFNVEERSEGDRYKTQAIYRTLAVAHAMFAVQGSLSVLFAACLCRYLGLRINLQTLLSCK